MRDGLAHTFLVRAPGRVNLIGDHTDYNGLPVLPMAIQRATTLLVRPRTDAVIKISSVDDRFPSREFAIDQTIVPFAVGDWGNYVKAAAQIVAREVPTTVGFDGVVGGDIPIAAGLSSSSALVVAVALALNECNRTVVEQSRLMELCARAERYVGTQGGGMDQAICLGGQAGYAFRIDFSPLRLTPCRVPDDWAFIVASTLVLAEKSGHAQAAYNARTRECKQALALLGSELTDAAGDGYPGLFRTHSASELEAVGDRLLPDPLRARFRHVVTESARVVDAQSALANEDLPRFGQLMNASHESLRRDYEVSCQELDDLVQLAREGGAAGARLTGAGFGGCIVALCRENETGGVLDALRRFYVDRGVDADASDAVFVARPSDGASVMRDSGNLV